MLIELMMVTVIIALLAATRSSTVPAKGPTTPLLWRISAARQGKRALFSENFRYPANDDDLIAEGYSHSPGVAFSAFQIRDANAEKTRVHMHIDHERSLQYYHFEYPKGYAGVPELRWK